MTATKPLATRLSRIQPSPTLLMTAKAIALKAEGHDVISLSAGEPDFDTPDHIKAGAIEAIHKGKTKYTAVDGTKELKEAIRNKFQTENNLSYNLDEIMVANGGKQVIFNALMATVNTGDEVIIPAPYWVSYPEMTALFGGNPVIIKTQESNGFKLTAEGLDQAITPKTKWLILNSPSNPTGSVYNKDELQGLINVLLQHPHVNIISDDIYEYLIYEGEFHSIVTLCPGLKDRTLIVNGVSKSYSMTGWRIGYGASGWKELIKGMAILQSQSTTNASSISQAAACVAINAEKNFLIDWKKAFKERRDLAHHLLNQIEGLSCLQPAGAFYLYINCEKFIGRQKPNGQVIQTDTDFVYYLLDQAKVATVSGDGFGLSPYFRISYAVSLKRLEEAIQRIKDAVYLLI